MNGLRRLLLVLGLLALGTGVSAAAPAAEQGPKLGQAGKDAIWIPTPDGVVTRMLTMAQVTPQDVVVDLGSGDGRMVLAAAKQFGARAIGVEYDAGLVALSRKTAKAQGLSEAQAKFVQADIFKYQFREATVVALYLLPAMLQRLRPVLLRLRPGTRIVSHHFKLEEWEPDEVSWVGVRGAYLWIVPADVAGPWRITLADRTAIDVDIEQRFQKFSGRAQLGELKAGLRDPFLKGDRVAFGLVDAGGVLREFSGQVLGDRIEGTYQSGGITAAWTAVRRGPQP